MSSLPKRTTVYQRISTCLSQCSLTCYIQFVPILLLDLSCDCFKSPTIVRVSLVESCLYKEDVFTLRVDNSIHCTLLLQIDIPAWIETFTSQRETCHNSISLVGGCPIENTSRGNLDVLMLNIYVAVFKNAKHVLVHVCECICGNVSSAWRVALWLSFLWYKSLSDVNAGWCLKKIILRETGLKWDWRLYDVEGRLCLFNFNIMVYYYTQYFCIKIWQNI
jgi:hypothetical protein